jgi:hypothetical protein
MFNRPRIISHIGTRRGQKGKATYPSYLLSLLRVLFLIASLALVVFYVHSAKSLFQHDFGLVEDATLNAAAPQLGQQSISQQLVQRVAKSDHQVHVDPIAKQARSSTVEHAKPMRYEDWRTLAVTLAALPADVVLQTLQTQDPFGVRHFEERLLDDESNRGTFLTLEQLKTDLFSCPADRITLPDQRDPSKVAAFRDPMNSTYLFFQHLRKAGGTNFCALAQDNLRRSAVAAYFCMPDMVWSGNKCAGCLDSYPNADIDRNMHTRGHRILGNEWDAFDASRFFALDAIFATSFRKPLDRALSQFRFECIEERGCTTKSVEEFWAKRDDLTNVYTWTFSRAGIRRISITNTRDAATTRQAAMGKALDAVSRFHLVLIMEWLAYADTQVKSVLGFQDTSALTRRVRPHIAQAKREDGQETNKLGAAGITKASWDPKEYLSPSQYKIMSENLALDEILTDAARRMFLERIVCDDMLPSSST